MKKSLVRAIAVVLSLLLFGAVPFSVAVAELQEVPTGKTVYYPAPAVFVDAGETVDLTAYDVMFTSSVVTAAELITWSSSALPVKDGTVTPPAAGVYALTATAGAQTKTVYVVAKEPSDTEYVLYQADFSKVSSVEELGYTHTKANASQTMTLSNGRLKLYAANANKTLHVFLPAWLEEFGDYTYQAGMEMTAYYNNTRWAGMIFRVQNDGNYYPYQTFTTRANAHSNASGVEISRTTEDGASWYKEFSATSPVNIYKNGEHTYRLEAYGTRLTASIDGNVIHDNDYPGAYVTGLPGLAVCGVTAEYSYIKITLDPARLDAIYGNAARKVLRVPVGQTVNLGEYGVQYGENMTLAADRLVWSSQELPVTANTVTPVETGRYALTAQAANPPKNRNGNVENSFVSEITLEVYNSVVPHAVPAIFANAGERVYLTDYSVMTDADTLADAALIQWSSESLSVKNGAAVPLTKGVYPLTAKIGAQTKNVYLVVKEPSKTEYVLYKRDFTQVASWAELEKEGWFIGLADAKQSVAVADGKLKLNGSAVSKNLRVMLPWWLAEFGDYTLRADMTVSAAYNTTRWVALSHRIQKENSYNPFHVFTTRVNSHTNPVGVEISRTNNAGSFHKEFGAANTVNIYQTGDHRYELKAYGTHLVGSIDGNVIHDNNYPCDYAVGGLGIIAGGTTAEISAVEVVLDRDAIYALYDNAVGKVSRLTVKAGETVDLSRFAVRYASGPVVAGEDLTWTSSDLTVTDGTVTPTKAGIYKVTCKDATPAKNVNGSVEADFTRDIYLMVDAQMTDVEEPATNVVMPATVITYIDNKAELDAVAAYATAPAVGVLRINAALEIVDAQGNKLADLEAAVKALGGRVLPAFATEDAVAAEKLAQWLKERGMSDCFILSSKGGVIRIARGEYEMLRGILDLSQATLSEVYEVRKKTNESGSRICLLPQQYLNKEDVEYLQRLLITVWCAPAENTVAQISAITAGVDGIVTKNPAALMELYTTHFDELTVVRAPGLVGHRGSPTLGQPNTVDSSVKAFEAGATAVENDIYLTTDGVIVIMHDSTIDATTDGSGKVEEMTYAQLQQYRVNANANVETQPIPTLAEYFEEFKGKDVQISVEIKSYKTAIVQPLVDLIKEYDIADQVNVISFTGSQLLLLKELMPEISTGILTTAPTYEATPTESAYTTLVYAQKYESTFNPNYTKGPLRPAVITAAYRRGVGIHAYTINTAADMQYYLHRGIGSMTTDYVQYMTDTVKRVQTAERAYVSAAREVEVGLTATTYGRETAAVTEAELKLLDGDDIFTWQNGKLVASGAGSATLMLSVTCTSPYSGSYRMVTEPFSVTVLDTLQGDADGDGVLTAADATVLMQALVGKAEEPALQISDLSGDRRFGIYDVVLLLRKLSE